MATTNATLPAAGSVTLTLAGNPSFPDNAALIEVSGSFTGVTATIQLSADGTNFHNVAALRLDTGSVEQTPTVSDATTRSWRVDATNAQKVRFNVTAISTNSITVQINSGFFPVSPVPVVIPTGNTGTNAPGGPNTQQTPVSAGANVAAAANNQTLPAAAGKFTYLSGFAVTGLGATSAGSVTITTTGLTNNLSFVLPVPAGVTAGVTPLVVTFNPPLQGSAVNTAIVVNVPSYGSGNTTASASAWGFQQ
jgi:hypothetical protein